MKKNFDKLIYTLKNRISVIFIIVFIMFLFLVIKFYKLQVIDYEKYATDLRASVQREIEIPATRGFIYDRYGRPLAVNQAVNVLKFDQQVKMSKDKLNVVLLRAIELIESEGDTYIDSIPISKQAPFEFTGTSSDHKNFIYNIPYNNEEHRQELLTYSAEELVTYLKKKFNISNTLSNEEVRKLLALRVEIYKSSYRQYKLVTLATNISEETMSQIEENRDIFPGIMVEVAPIRFYPEGKVFGNILGYTRTITDEQFKKMRDFGYSYEKDDQIGQMGIEETLESELKGLNGIEKVEVDNLGRRVHTVSRKESLKGNDVFLTLDLNLQKATYNSLEKWLGEALIVRLSGGNKSVKPLSSKEFIKSMVESNQLLIDQMKWAKNSSKQKEIYERLISSYEKIDPLIRKNFSVKELLLEWIDESLITEKELLLAMYEQGSIILSSDILKKVQEDKKESTESLLIELIRQGGIRAGQCAVDPFSGAAVMVDVHSGEVLSLVGYPSFDNNQMISDFNRYYLNLTDGFDKRSALVNRALKTAKAPGSTFKMLTAIAGLEEGVITPSTQFYDTGTFTKAGAPYPHCWVLSSSGGGHGMVDLKRALEVSCNYYFYEVAYRLGKKNDDPYANIDILNQYVSMFGLDKKTGVQLEEVEPNASTPMNLALKSLNEVFYRLENMNEDDLQKKIREVIQVLEKGIYPYVNSRTEDMDSQIDYLTQYELKRYLDPLLQETFLPYYNGLLSDAYSELQRILKEKNRDEVVKNLVSSAMNDSSEISLKNKVHSYMIEQLNNLIGPSLENEINQIVNKLSDDELLDAYDKAYLAVYRSEIRKKETVELTKELYKRRQQLNVKKEEYKDELVVKIRQNIVNIIANNLLNGVELEWTDALTVRTAIGQGNNAFSPLQIARYIAGIANEKEIYNLSIIKGIYDAKNTQTYEEIVAKKLNDIHFKKSTMDEIHKGMLAVATGSEGTSRVTFKQLPFEIGAKTGTAQDGGHEHTWFVGFAPYKSPDIAIVVTLYNSEGLGTYSQFIAKDMIESYFKLNVKKSMTTLDNVFIE